MVVRYHRAFANSIGLRYGAGQISGRQCRTAHVMKLTLCSDNAHDLGLEAKPTHNAEPFLVCLNAVSKNRNQKESLHI